jgi:hypothetical protein
MDHDLLVRNIVSTVKLARLAGAVKASRVTVDEL